MFDITFVGHYTKDTIVYPTRTTVVNGGAYYYGAHVAARMGKRVAVVTRLAREDWGALDDLERLGVTMRARETPASTHLRLTYPTDNMDQRTIEMTRSAGPFTLDQLEGIESRVFAIVASSARGEVSQEVVEALAGRGAMIALDVQGFIRVVSDGTLGFDDWPGKERILRHVNVLKTDAVEAELLTGESDRYKAARRLAEFGPREVLLTHGGGVLVCHDGVIDQAPLVPRELRGRSGRGDTCTSAYLCRRLSAPPEDAVVWAAAVTSLKLETEGPFRRDLSEVEALYQHLLPRRQRVD
ncbi:MAG: carbohydrate kinase [Chloroflexi bacterium]|nr:carbohydrate kinase [Chloroflexota bacterium]